MSSSHEQFRREAFNHIPFADMSGLASDGHTKVASGWKWDDHLNGYVSQGALTRFACTGCGSDVETPSYVKCACGKIWNSYPISSQSREAGAIRYIAREVPRRDTILASRPRARTARRRVASTGVKIVEDSPSPGHQRELLAVADDGQIKGRVIWWEPSGIVAAITPAEHDDPIREELHQAANAARPDLRWGSDSAWDEPVENETRQAYVGRIPRIARQWPEHHRNYVSPDEPLAIRHPEPRNVPGITFHPASSYYSGHPSEKLNTDDGFSQTDTEFPGDDEHHDVTHVVARHPDGRDIGHLTWTNGDEYSAPQIDVASVHPDFQRQGIGNAMMDAVRNRYAPRLEHSKTLSFQGRKFALGDKANPDMKTAENAIPFNLDERGRAWDPGYNYVPEGVAQDAPYGEYSPVRPNEENSMAAAEHFDDSFGDGDDEQHPYGYDEYGSYVGHENGGYNAEGYNADGVNGDGLDEDGFDEDGFDANRLNREGRNAQGYEHPRNSELEIPAGHQSMQSQSDRATAHGTMDLLDLDPEAREQLENASQDYVQGYRVQPRGLRNRGYDYDAHIGHGDTVYTSLAQARANAHHPTDPNKDHDIISAELDPARLYGDPSTPHTFTYHADPQDDGSEISVEGSVHHDDVSNGRIVDGLNAGRTNPDWSHVPAQGRYGNGHFAYEGGPLGSAEVRQRYNGLWEGTPTSGAGEVMRPYGGANPAEAGRAALTGLVHQYGLDNPKSPTPPPPTPPITVPDSPEMPPLPKAGRRLARSNLIADVSTHPEHERVLVARFDGEIVGSISWWPETKSVNHLSPADPDSNIRAALLATAKDEEPGLIVDAPEEHRWDTFPEDERRTASMDPEDHDDGIDPYTGKPRLNGEARVPGGVTFDWAPGNSDRNHGRDGHIVAKHSDGRVLGHLDWDSNGVIGSAHVHPHYQGQGVGLAMLDEARANRGHPQLKHSDTLSLKGRAFALADKGNPDRHRSWNTRPFNYNYDEDGEYNPHRFVPKGEPADAPARAITDESGEDHSRKLKDRYDAEGEHLGDSDPEYGYDDSADHEYGYDENGYYVGGDGQYDAYGRNDMGYDADGRDEDGYDEYGRDEDGYDTLGQDEHGYERPAEYTSVPNGHVSMDQMRDHLADEGLAPRMDNTTSTMLDEAADDPYELQRVYRVRNGGQGSGEARIGNGDTVYSSLDRARQEAHHPDDPSQDKEIISGWGEPSSMYAHPNDPHTWTHLPEEHAPASFEASRADDPISQGRVKTQLGGAGWAPIVTPGTRNKTSFMRQGEDGAAVTVHPASHGGWQAQYAPPAGGSFSPGNAFFHDSPAAIGEWANQKLTGPAAAPSNEILPGIPAPTSRESRRMTARRRTAQLIPGHELTAGDIVEQNGRALQVVETKSHLDKEGQPLVTVTLQGEAGDSFVSEYPVAGDPPQFNLIQSADGGGGEGGESPDGAGPAAAPGADPGMGDPGADPAAADPYAALPTDDDPNGGMPPQGPPGMAAPAPSGVGAPTEAPEDYSEIPTDDDPDANVPDLPNMPQPQLDEVPEDPNRMPSRQSSYNGQRIAGVVDDYEYWTRQNNLDPQTSLTEYDQTHQITQEEYDLIEQQVMEDTGIHLEGGTSMDSGTQDVGPAFPDMNQEINDAPEIQSFASRGTGYAKRRSARRA